MFKRMFGPYENTADRWKGRLIWVFVILPAVCGWVSISLFILILVASWENSMIDSYSIMQEIIFISSVLYFFTSGAFAWFQMRASNARGNTTRHTIRETIRERPQFEDYEDGDGDYELESWTNKETPFGIESERVDTGLNEAQVLAHLKQFPPSTNEECKRLLQKYKKSKKIKLLLLGVSKEIKAKANTRAIKAANSDRTNHSPSYELIP